MKWTTGLEPATVARCILGGRGLTVINPLGSCNPKMELAKKTFVKRLKRVYI